GAQFLVAVGFASAARAELHEVEIAFTQRNKPHKNEKLQPAVKLRWLQTDAANQEIDPLIRCESGAALPVVIQIEIGELDRSEVLDPEGASLSKAMLIHSALWHAERLQAKDR